MYRNYPYLIKLHGHHGFGPIRLRSNRLFERMNLIEIFNSITKLYKIKPDLDELLNNKNSGTNDVHKKNLKKFLDSIKDPQEAILYFILGYEMMKRGGNMSGGKINPKLKSILAKIPNEISSQGNQLLKYKNNTQSAQDTLTTILNDTKKYLSPHTNKFINMGKLGLMMTMKKEIYKSLEKGNKVDALIKLKKLGESIHKDAEMYLVLVKKVFEKLGKNMDNYQVTNDPLKEIFNLIDVYINRLENRNISSNTGPTIEDVTDEYTNTENIEKSLKMLANENKLNNAMELLEYTPEENVENILNKLSKNDLDKDNVKIEEVLDNDYTDTENIENALKLLTKNNKNNNDIKLLEYTEEPEIEKKINKIINNTNAFDLNTMSNNNSDINTKELLDMIKDGSNDYENINATSELENILKISKIDKILEELGGYKKGDFYVIPAENFEEYIEKCLEE